MTGGVLHVMIIFYQHRPQRVNKKIQGQKLKVVRMGQEGFKLS